MSNSKLQLVMILVLATVFGFQFPGERGLAMSPQNSDDHTIAENIKSKLFGDSLLKMRDIHVASKDGVVTLSGVVNTDLEKSAVERIASREPGVTQIVDNLTVSASPATPPPASTPAPAVSAAAGGAPAPPVASSITVPAETKVTVRMVDAIDSTKNQPGDEFSATVASPVVVEDQTAIAQDSNARVRLVDVKNAGRLTGRSSVKLQLVSLTINGANYAVQSYDLELQGKSRTKGTLEKAAVGAGAGGVLGGILKGGKGAGIGAGAGGAGGTAAQAASKPEPLQVPSEAKIDFTLLAPLTVTLGNGQMAATDRRPPAGPPGAPVIASVSPILPTGNQTFTIRGTGFGNHDPFNGCSNYLSIQDVPSNIWIGVPRNGPTSGCAGPWGGSNPSIYVKSWSDSEIVVGGLGWAPRVGDVLVITVANAQGKGIVNPDPNLKGAPVAKLNATVTDAQ